MNQALLETATQLVHRNRDLCSRRSGDEKILDWFYDQFPAESLLGLTLESYCLGTGSRAENFSWWIERGLFSALGRYSPGSAKGHMLYRKPDGTYYMHSGLAPLGTEGAVDAIKRVIHAIANCRSWEDAAIFDDPKALREKLGLDPNTPVGGNARMLRILSVYHPEWVVPVNSETHLRSFLEQFRDEPSFVMPKGSVQLAKALDDVRKEIEAEVDGPLTPFGFMKLLYNPEFNLTLPEKQNWNSVAKAASEESDPEINSTIPLNQILYGPPGTGKTYSTIGRALEIIDPQLFEEVGSEAKGRERLKERFDQLVRNKRIGFVTFHQSFSYEDFVEGLKATTDDDGQIRYEVEGGIFKQMCETALAEMQRPTASAAARPIDFSKKRIWKMSLGSTRVSDSSTYDQCIEKGLILLGWGQDADFTGVSDRAGVVQRLEQTSQILEPGNFAVTACNAFVNQMQVGDLVVVTDGNHKFRAIGRIDGPYRFLTEGIESSESVMPYQQSRSVDWLRTFETSLPWDRINNRAFSQQAIYQLKPPAIDHEKLQEFMQPREQDSGSSPKPFVLIIDEINRGNISRVFGELITLIEDSKRLGEPEALTVTLPYTKKPFTVPKNLYLIGTMNTADRSLAQIDIALRRRFVFEELMPNPGMLADLGLIDGVSIKRLLETINQRIEVLYDREHMIGHTFFLSLREDPSLAELQRIFEGRILPLLEEYFFEDWEKIRQVLADNQKAKDLQMIRKKYSDSELMALLGTESEHVVASTYERNEEALSNPDAYIAVYDPKSMVGTLE